MCLSTVYLLGADGQREMVADCITGVVVDGLFVTVTDIMGSSTVLEGIIKSVDLVGNTLEVQGKHA